MKFAELAEKNRLEMLSRKNLEFFAWKKETDRLSNPMWWHPIADCCWDRLPTRVQHKLEELIAAW